MDIITRIVIVAKVISYNIDVIVTSSYSVGTLQWQVSKPSLHLLMNALIVFSVT